MRLPDGQSESPAEVAQRDSTGPVGVQCLPLLQLPQREVDKLPQRGRAVLEVLLGVGVHSAQQLLVHRICSCSSRAPLCARSPSTSRCGRDSTNTLLATSGGARIRMPSPRSSWWQSLQGIPTAPSASRTARYRPFRTATRCGLIRCRSPNPSTSTATIVRCTAGRSTPIRPPDTPAERGGARPRSGAARRDAAR